MSGRPGTASPGVEADAGMADDPTATGIRARGDVEGCGCLDCQDVDAATLRRSVLDSLVWSVRLFRTYPSVPALALALVLGRRLLDGPLARSLPVPVVDLLDLLALLGLVVLLRAYVAEVVAGELAGHRPSVRRRFGRDLGRVLALVGAFWAVFVAVSLASFAVTTLAFGAFLVADVNPMTTFGTEVVFVGLVALSVLPFLFVLFKFWLALEACVVGRYGPVESLRVSWRLTRRYRGRFLRTLAGALGTAGVLFLVGSLAGPDGGLVPSGPALTAAATGLGELTSVAWYGVYAHLYVQGAVED